MTPRLQRALLEAVGALDELGLRYAVVGGLAVGIWAEPRATRVSGHYERASRNRPLGTVPVRTSIRRPPWSHKTIELHPLRAR